MTLKQTPLHAKHTALGAKMCGFAGYDMPIDYATGTLKEHEWTRANAGLFDVSHMGQAIVEGDKAAEFFSTITPSSFLKTAHGRARYTVLTNEQGGIIDDLIITRMNDTKFFVVYNAGRKEVDLAWMKKNLPAGVNFTELADHALLALQGPRAEEVLAREFPAADVANIGYMTLKEANWRGAHVFISRLGYTGEDGFEISIPAEKAPAFWDALLTHPEVKAIGLAARDSLRLEMGYPLYGHDLDETTSPVEAALGWVMTKGHDAFIGAKAILGIEPTRKRVGIKLTGPGIAREGSPLFVGSEQVGTLSSGGFSPTLKAAIGQGYVKSDFAKDGQAVEVEVRGRRIPAIVQQNLSFVPAKTKQAKQATPNLKSA
jgi:aminomethyltransferase